MAVSKTKYIFVTGGVLSGLGKGITAASLANTLKARGLSVNIQKCDVYLNVDAGTLNPAEHGECYVTSDGAETDLDLGHYERFLDIELTRTSSLMSGRVFLELIQAEREGKFLGKSVQFIPHLTSAIADKIIEAGKGFDVHFVEIGGTVGDIEANHFIEAIREMPNIVGSENCLYMHLVYMPHIQTSKEFKTKPAQNSVRELRSYGISPDVLAVRSDSDPGDTKALGDKLSIFTGVPVAGIAFLPNAATVYEVPLSLEDQNISDYVVDKLGLKNKKPDHKAFRQVVASATDIGRKKVKIGVVAKYLDNEDTYMSVFEALKAAAWNAKVDPEIHWIDAEKITKKNVASKLKKLDGILVPGGFGLRGLEGKIIAARYAMDAKMPYLGLCLGMQMAVVAFARKHLDQEATSLEMDEQADVPVIHLMEDQRTISSKGGTMRLGDYECVLKKGSLARKVYAADSVLERHRHRYEFNNDYREALEEKGLVISGTSPDGELVEIIELADHPYFIATQAHPELKSRPTRPHPLFSGFVKSLKN